MGSSIYGDVGGASRKGKDLYAKVGGVNRKFKEAYAKVNGVVRKIYEGYDCQATINDTDSGTHSSYIRSDGSGFLHVWSSYYDTDPATYTAYIDLTFKDIISYTACPRVEPYNYYDYKNPQPDSCVKFLGSWPDSEFGKSNIDHEYYIPLNNHDCHLMLIDLERPASNDIISAQTPGYTPHTYEIPKYGLTVKYNGSSRHFRIMLRSTLEAREGSDDEQFISWDKLIFLGKELDSVELI